MSELGASVQTGRFRTDMAVESVNDRPVTLLLEARRSGTYGALAKLWRRVRGPGAG